MRRDRKGRSTTLKTVLLAGGASLIAGAAQAQTAPATGTSFAIGEVVVTTARPATVTDVLTSVDILGGDVAQRQNVDSTFKLLGQVPGVLVTDYHQGGTNGSVSFRGFNAEGGISAVKLLIDGVPSNSNDGFMWMLDSVPPLDVASVEVVRGTSDPRYGLHSIAGNVSLFTRQGGTYADGKLTYGSWNTFEAQASLGYESGRFAQNYAVDYRTTEGYRDRGDQGRRSLAGKWFYKGDGFKVGAIGRYFEADGKDSGFLTPAQAEANPRQSPALNASDGRSRKGGEYSLHLDADLASGLIFSGKAYVNGFKDTRFFRIASTVLQQERILSEHQEGAIGTLRWTPQVSFLHDFSLEGGADVQSQNNHHVRLTGTNRVRGAVSFNRQFKLQVYGGYMQAVIEPTDWLKITPALRLDWVDGDFLNVVSGARFPDNDYRTISQPKLSAVVTPWDGISVYANYGRTFQIAIGISSYIVPPQVSNVRPSINEGWETGVKVSREPFDARLALWNQTATGEVLLNNFTGDFSNLGATKRTGFDAQFSYSPGRRLSLWVAYSYQKGEIVTPDPATPTFKGNRIDHVPANLFSGGLDYRPIDPLRLSLTYMAQSKYELDSSNSRGRYGDRSVANVEVAYRIMPKVEVSGEVKNLTNNRSSYVYYDPTTRTALHSPHDGRGVFANLRVTY